MESLFDFIYDRIPDSWFDSFHKAWGDNLTDEVIVQSVQEASDFFNLNAPINVHEDWTTGVMTGMDFTENDDILVFNRQQMQEMGITDKEGFDLVMTHEGAHRALQGIDTGFNSHQEELCCDYMAGVRAGLNGMDEGKMIASLENTTESLSHPDGEKRVQAIEAGVAFAHAYRESHNGLPPTFSDCMEHFEKSDIYISAAVDSAAGQVNLREENVRGYTLADVEWYERQARISSGSEQEHWLKEAQWAKDHLDGFVPSCQPNENLSQFYGGGQFENTADGNVIDFHSENHDDNLKGFVNDRSYHLKRAQIAEENAEWHYKRMKDAIAKGDLSAARDHEHCAESYERSRRDYLAAAEKCTE
jgi:hypothetical protein